MLTAIVTQSNGRIVNVRLAASDTTDTTVVGEEATTLAAAPSAEGETATETKTAPNPIAPETKVIISSGNENRANAVEAIASGAYDFYAKPVDIDVLTLIIRRALPVYDLEAESRQRQTVSTTPLAGLITSAGL